MGPWAGHACCGWCVTLRARVAVTIRRRAGQSREGARAWGSELAWATWGRLEGASPFRSRRLPQPIQSQTTWKTCVLGGSRLPEKGREECGSYVCMCMEGMLRAPRRDLGVTESLTLFTGSLCFSFEGLRHAGRCWVLCPERLGVKWSSAATFVQIPKAVNLGSTGRSHMPLI